MLTDNDLQELLGYYAQSPVLSVYLNTDPSEGSADGYRLRLRNMLKVIELREDVEAVERYFNHEFDWSGRSVAVFSCAPETFFRAYPLAVPVHDRVRINSQPHVKPLADILDAYGGYGVALVDKQGARLFHIHLGEIKEQEGVMGEAVHHTKRGGASQVAGRRGGVAGRTNYEDELVERNMREAADFAAHFFGEKNVRRVLLAGTDDNLAIFRTLLPKSWQSLIVGSFPMSMTASKNEVLERSLLVGQEAEQRREAQLVNTVITGAAKGGRGAIRLDDTLSAVHDGRVQTLLIKEGFRAPGYRCTGCGYLTAQQLEICPFCGKNFEEIPDAVEMAVHKVMELGGEVEVLHDGEITQEFGNIAALLRY
jgi:peptide chain release factor subunit 1